jgi:hypothetical protein
VHGPFPLRRSADRHRITVSGVSGQATSLTSISSRIWRQPAAAAMSGANFFSSDLGAPTMQYNRTGERIRKPFSLWSARLPSARYTTRDRRPKKSCPEATLGLRGFAWPGRRRGQIPINEKGPQYQRQSRAIALARHFFMYGTVCS